MSIYNFLVQNQSFIAAYFPLILSTISLVISIKVEWNSRNRIYFEHSEGAVFLPYHAIYATDEMGHYVENSGFPEGFDLHISIVNMSSAPIGYFDLCAFDTTENKQQQLPLMTKSTMDPHLTNFTWKRENAKNPIHPSILHIPDSWTGFFPANSSTDWNLICFPPETCKKLTIVFRVAMKKPFWMKRDPLAVGDDRHYRYFSQTLDISHRAEFADCYKKRPMDFTSLEDLVSHRDD